MSRRQARVTCCGCAFDSITHEGHDTFETHECEDYRTQEDDALGSCGCVDYHYADCPTRTGGSGMTADDYLMIAERNPDLFDRMMDMDY